MSVRIVTDSACDVPEEIAAELGITVVPVYINIGEESYLEGVELPRHTFYQKLSNYPVYPTTAAPASGAFTEAYRRLAEEGASEIVSIHIASSLSATYNAARLGIGDAYAAVPVTLIDTQQITLGAGLLVILAAEAALAGYSGDEIRAMLQARIPRTRVFGMIDNLDALRRSGRVSWAEFGLGTLLQVKPVMLISQGKIEVAAKIRTRKRAESQMMSMVEEYGPFERMAVIHVDSLKMAEQLRIKAEHLMPKDQAPISGMITPAIGIHLGIGAAGFACISAD